MSEMNQTKITKKYIIALTGKRGVGKSTVASYLSKRYKFSELSFANPLKQACSTMLDVPLNWFYDQSLKEKVIPYWGNTPRYFLQKWGTDIFRDYVPTITPEIKSIWIQRMEKIIKESSSNVFVISDCRFNDEAEFIKKLSSSELYYTQVIEIQGVNRIPGSTDNDSVSSHSSEQGIDENLIDITIGNDTNKVKDLYNIIDGLIKDDIKIINECKANEDNEDNSDNDYNSSDDDIIIDTRNNSAYNSSKLIINGIDQTHLINPSVSASATIGQKGEQYVYDIIKKAYPEVEVENITSKARAGDILFRPHLQSVGYKAQIMFEVKKYSRKVPTQEYDKFLRDIRESNHDAGVFISLSSEIVGVTNSIIVKTINTERDGQLVPIIIANTDNKEIIESLISLIIGYITLIRKQSSYVNQTDFTVQIINSLQESLNNYNNIRAKVHELRNNNEKMLDVIQDSLTANYTEIRTLLNQLHGMIAVDTKDTKDTTDTKDTKASCDWTQYHYSKDINHFLLRLHEKFNIGSENTGIKIDYGDKKITITGPITIEFVILKTKVNCSIGKFKSNNEVYTLTHKAVKNTCKNKSESVSNGGTNDCDDIYNSVPFDDYTISKGMFLKFELKHRYYDIIMEYLAN